MILGWDIGGVNTKIARRRDAALIARSRPFELQRSPDTLVRVLQELAAEVGATTDSLTCAVTMTAELSQMFRTKREGVSFVLDAVSSAFPDADIRVFTISGQFVSPAVARREPLAVAAANWVATARLVAQRYPTTLLVDVGTTTSDIIPIVDGQVVATGMTDPARLASGELVYTGALRTPVEAIVRDVPYRDGSATVSAEAFALIGDVHLWRGRIGAEEYSVPTPDGRGATRECAGERLARVICADRELLDEVGVSRIADAIAAAQVDAIAAAISRVTSSHPTIETAVVTGLGAFIASDAARAAGLRVISLAGDIGNDVARYAPAAAVAILCEQDRGADPVASALRSMTVIKLGGALLEHIDHLDRLLDSLADSARIQNVVIVPGGGPFAEAVRHIDARIGLGDDEAHWMAVLGMDQYAHLLAARLVNGVVVVSPAEIESALRRQQIPVLAPSRWLQAADPLPHTWDVTSDSIAAWAAGELGASRLVLVKAPGASGPGLVDPYFHRTIAATVAHESLAAEEAMQLLNQIARNAAVPAATALRSS